jgi:hypothetical protein
MCEPVTAALTTLFAGGAGATAAGATAGAATFGGVLQTVAGIASIAGPLVMGIQGAQAAKAQSKMVAQERAETAKLTAIADDRSRRQFASQIREQASQFAGRGLDAGSATAVFLGQTAAEEMVFNSQSQRQTGQARDTELSNQQAALRARASSSLFGGGIGAATGFLTAAPRVWPELLK